MKAYQIIKSASKYVAVDLTNIIYCSTKQKVVEILEKEGNTIFFRESNTKVDAEWIENNILESVYITVKINNLYYHITEINIL